MNFTEESHPEAYKLLNSFRPSAQKPHPRLERSTRGKILLKGMQITAGFTLGLLAWDKRDRATAAKRYREALDLAETHPPFMNLPPGTIGWELYVHKDILETKENLGRILQNDMLHADLLAQSDGSGKTPGRRDVVDLPLPQMRIDKTGAATLESSVAFATNACSSCGKRDLKLLRCGLCKTTFYCNAECQKADWPVHKKVCAGKVGKAKS